MRKGVIFLVASMHKLMQNSAETVKGFAKRLKVPNEAVEAIQAGQADIIDYNGQKTGVYRDIDGEIHSVSVICPHLGCQLSWNQNDLSWDCPCHGSRFDIDGELIDNPAVRGIHNEEELSRIE